MDNSLAVLREKEGAERFQRELQLYRENGGNAGDLAYVNASMKDVRFSSLKQSSKIQRLSSAIPPLSSRGRACGQKHLRILCHKSLDILSLPPIVQVYIPRSTGQKLSLQLFLIEKQTRLHSYLVTVLQTLMHKPYTANLKNVKTWKPSSRSLTLEPLLLFLFFAVLAPS